MSTTSVSQTSPQHALPQTLRVYNTLTGNKEPFVTQITGKVGIYLCGPTVYKPSHIGHMVGPVIFDAIKRYLNYCGYDVHLVVNITDVDDKLIAEAQRRNLPMAEVAREMTEDYLQNLSAMGIDTIDSMPRATDHIPHIIEFTKDLISAGIAYESEGDVYFEVAKFPQYGRLSHRSHDMLQGSGGGAAERKRAVNDFALWKSAKPGEPSWDSPWGKGRPGWHIECSAMAKAILGKTLDIHGGGLDLVFPHHENEVAQSEALHNAPLARYWLHNGLMQASDEVGKVGGRATRAADAPADLLGEQQAQEENKIGKSKGASAFRDLLAKFDPETIRFFLLSTHYRRPIDFSEGRINEVGRGLEAFYRFIRRYQRITTEDFYSIKVSARREDSTAGAQQNAGAVSPLRLKFLESMDDDFNTGGAIGVLFELVSALNRFADQGNLEEKSKANPAALADLKAGAQILKELAATLGLFMRPVAEKQEPSDELVGQLMSLVIEIRAEARKTKNFPLADKIRQSLASFGITLEDRQGGTEWTRG